MQMLKAKLYMLKQQEQAEKGLRNPGRGVGHQLGPSDSLLRAAALHHGVRTCGPTWKPAMVNSVLDGNIDLFINGYLKWCNLSR